MLTFHIKLVSFKNIEILLIYGPKSIKFGAYAQIWLYHGHWWAVGVGDPLKRLVTGPSLLVNCYLGNKFHKKNQAGHVIRNILNTL